MIMMPSWRMPGSDGRTWTSAELKGSTYIMYFYPKDQTPGCTIQACEFRDSLARLQAAGVKVFGVSPDSLASHHKFAAKEKLTFPLLTDNDHSLATKLAVWAEKSLYGRTFPGIERTTFLIGPEGTIIGEWRKVKVAGHVAEVISAATGLTVPPPAVAQVPPTPSVPPLGINKSTAMVAKPIPVAAKPALVAARPILVAAKPALVAAKPALVAAKPIPVAAKPALAAAKPITVAAKPAPVAAKPTLVAPPAAKPAVVDKVIAKPVAVVKAVAKAVAKAVVKAKPKPAGKVKPAAKAKPVDKAKAKPKAKPKR